MLTNTLLIYVTQEALSKARARLLARRRTRNERAARPTMRRRRRDAATRH